MTDNKFSSLQAINLSPLNTSKSKAMFSFTKASRFPDIKEGNCSLYEKPSMLNKRATTFGFGTKSELINKYNYSPSPDKYQKSSIFEKNPKKGISIGIGRQDCKNVSIFNQSCYPAPTDYNKTFQKENSPHYSIRQKVKLPVLFGDSQTPGPGQYENSKISDNGKAFISKYKSFISFKIHDLSPKKVEKQKALILGPMSYNTMIPSTGKQLLSKHKTEKSFIFDKKPRETFFIQSKAPGPGAYNSFSQFNR